MTDTKDLVPDILRNIQKDLSDVKRTQTNMHEDMRAGFASIRAHIEAVQRDINLIERRVDRVEDDIRGIKSSLDFPKE